MVNGDSNDHIGDFNAINRELQLFSSKLAAKPQVVVVNKIDLPHVADRKDEIIRELQNNMSHKRLLCISAAGRIETDNLMDRVYKFLCKVREDEEDEEMDKVNEIIVAEKSKLMKEKLEIIENIVVGDDE